MATKPTKTPDFNTGGANNTEPNGAKKILGWVVNEAAASSYFNWLHKLTSEWLAYLRDGVFVGETGQPAIDATNGTGNVDAIRGTSSGATAAGVKGTASNGGVGVHGVGQLGGIGMQGDGNDTGTGVWGNGGVNAPGVFGQGGANNQAGVWGTGGGTGAGVKGLKGTGTAGLETDGTLKFTQANPAATVGAKNELNPMQCIKAWAYLSMDGAGGITVLKGSNIASASLPGSSKVRVTFTQKFADLNPAALGRGTLLNTQNIPLALTNDAPHDDGTGKTDYYEFKLTADNGSTYFNPASDAPGAVVRVLFLGAQ